MATLKVVLDKRYLKTDGTYPVAIRITHQTRTRSITFSIRSEEWDEANQLVHPVHPNAASLNREITKKVLQVEEAIQKLESSNRMYRVNEIKALLAPQKIKQTNPNFLEFTQQQIELLKQSGKYDIKRDYGLRLLDVNPLTREVQVGLEIRTPLEGPSVTDYSGGEFQVSEAAGYDKIEAKFWVGPFDFPMIDNPRLTNDQRCAVILKKFQDDLEESVMIVTLLTFPGSHSGLKEKPYYEEAINRALLKQGATVKE